MAREERRSADRPTRRRERVLQGDASRSHGDPHRRHDDRADLDGPDTGTLALEGVARESEHAWGGRRADESICEEVRDLLGGHPEIDAAHVEVLVEEGEVTLQGAVPDRDMRRLAEGVAESVAGVSLVHNRLRLALP